MKIKSSSEKSHVGWKWVEKEIGGLWLEVCTAELMCVSVDAWVYLCVSSYWDQMKYPSVSMAIDQSAAAPMMDITALIAPLMPSVSLTHTLLHSHSFIYLPLFFSPLLTPPFQLCGTQTETNHRFNEIKFGGRPGVGTFVSHLLTAAAVAHLSHLTDSTVWYYFC